ncbi:MAG: ion channel [Dermatophilaceae bacterium]
MSWLSGSLRTHPSGWLLGTQLGALLIYPFVGDSDLGHAILAIVGLAVITLALGVVRASPALTWVGILLGVPSVVLSALEVLRPDSAVVTIASGMTHAAFYFFVSWGLIRYIFDDDDVSTDELYASGAAFTVVAWAFAYLFAAAQAVWPDAFGADRRTWFELLFLSFSCVTSVGLSDILPAAPMARSLVMIADFTGVMYLALVVSRIVGLTVKRVSR